MDWTYGELRARVKTLGGIDATDEQVGAEVNAKYVDLVVRAKWRMGTVQVATTVSGQSNYSIAEADVDLEGLRIGSVEYERIGQEEMWGLASGRLVQRRRVGMGGYFAPDWDAAGVAQVEIWPAPSTDGDSIETLTALEPAQLTADGDVPIVPRDFRPKIADGAVGSLLALVDERHDQAQVWEAKFEKAVSDLERRKNSRVGRGGTQIRIQGVHF